MTIINVIYGLWFAGIALLGALAVVLIKRKVWERFPIFTAYVLVSFLEAAITLVLRDPVFFAYVYRTCELLGMLLGLGVVYEIFKNVFASHEALRRLASTVFLGALVVMIAVGCIVMYTHAPVQGSRFVPAMVIVEEGLRIIEVGMVMALFLLSGAFGLHWRQQVFGVALGLGVFAIVALAGIALRARMGPQTVILFSVARGLSFDTSLLVWLGYLLVPERVRSQTTVPQRGQLEQWNQAVKELIYQ